MTVQMFRNIEATYNLGTPDQITRGLEWYLRGNLILRDIQEETGLSLEMIAAICAHLSPRISWTANIKGTWCMALDLPILSGIMARSWDMALIARRSSDPLSTLNGPKVSAFAGNLLLMDMNRVTVDVWALRAAGVGELDIKRKGAYEQVEAAYQEVADKLGIAPARLQAIVWIIVKENWKRGQTDWNPLDLRN